MLNIIILLAKMFVLCFIIIIIMIKSIKAKVKNQSMISNFQRKSIRFGIGIGNTGTVITWYRIDSKICSIAHPYFLRMHRKPPGALTTQGKIVPRWMLESQTFQPRLPIYMILHCFL